MIWGHGCQFHKYADDTQLDDSTPSWSSFPLPQHLSRYLHRMLMKLSVFEWQQAWSAVFLIFSFTVTFIHKIPLSVSEICFKDNVRDCGNFLDATISLYANLVTYLILSRFDNCNSLLAGLPAHNFVRLQCMYKNAASLICRTKKTHVNLPCHEYKSIQWKKNKLNLSKWCCSNLTGVDNTTLVQERLSHSQPHQHMRMLMMIILGKWLKIIMMEHVPRN